MAPIIRIEIQESSEAEGRYRTLKRFLDSFGSCEGRAGISGGQKFFALLGCCFLWCGFSIASA